ncbi:hypothetical protein [Streptomyces sp. LN549]|uniref:hypothetical protein n=1 Tax=Streptomyces sp. LN549 TaxID=3112979 RepID=UPI003711BABC
MTGPTREQLLHLADRARRGVALDAEHDALAAGITAMADRLDRANKAIRFMLQQDADAADTAVRAIQLMNEAGAQRHKAEAAIERVRNLATLAPDGAKGPTWAALELAIDNALPEQQPTT